MPSFLSLIYQLDSEHLEGNCHVRGDRTASEQEKSGSLNTPIATLPIQFELVQEINFICQATKSWGYL